MKSTILAALLLLAIGAAPPASADGPSWATQVAGSFSEEQAKAAYDALSKNLPSIFSGVTPVVVRGVMTGGGTGSFYHVVIPAPNRDDAEAFCKRLEAAGGACVVERTALPSS